MCSNADGIYHYCYSRDPVPLISTLVFGHDIGLSRLLTGMCKSIGRGGENINNALIYKKRIPLCYS